MCKFSKLHKKKNIMFSFSLHFFTFCGKFNYEFKKSVITGISIHCCCHGSCCFPENILKVLAPPANDQNMYVFLIVLENTHKKTTSTFFCIVVKKINIFINFCVKNEIAIDRAERTNERRNKTR